MAEPHIEIFYLLMYIGVKDPLIEQTADVADGKGCGATSSQFAARGPGSKSPTFRQEDDSVEVDSGTDETLLKISKMIVDGVTSEQFVRQLHNENVVKCFLTNPKVDGKQPDNAVWLQLKPNDPDSVPTLSCMGEMVPLYNKNGKADKHFLKMLAPTKPTFTLDMTNYTCEELNQVLASGPLEFAYIKTGRDETIPKSVQEAMDRITDKTRHHVFLVTEEQMLELQQPNMCWKSWSGTEDFDDDEDKEKCPCYHSEMAKSSSVENPADDRFPWLTIKPEVMQRDDSLPRLDYTDKTMMGCVQLEATKVVHTAGENDDGEAGQRPQQQRLGGAFLKTAAGVSCSAERSTAGSSQRKFCEENVAFVFKMQIKTTSKIITTNPINDTVCPICLDNLGEDKIALECQHQLHPECYKQLWQYAVKKSGKHIKCPTCCHPTSWTHCAQYGDVDYRASVQDQIAEEKQQMQLSLQFVAWLRQEETRSKIWNHIRCESIYKNAKKLLNPEEVKLSNYEAVITSVQNIFETRGYGTAGENWIMVARSKSCQINRQIQNCLWTIATAKNVQSINEAQQKMNQLIADLNQQIDAESELVKYICDLQAHVQVLCSSLEFNLKEQCTLDTLRAWQIANAEVQILLPGWEKFCISNEELQQFGHILRGKWPTHFCMSEFSNDVSERTSKIRKIKLSSDVASDDV